MFPDAKSPDLILDRPTPEEKQKTWELNSQNWGKALGKSKYIEREQYLATVPLTTEGGISYWCLVDKNAKPNNRELYATCESIRKRALLSNDGAVYDVTVHAIGSVFCDPKYRGRKYASRMLTEVGSILRTYQIDSNLPGRGQVAASILFSDIGKKYYANHGWLPFPSSHISLQPRKSMSTDVTPLKASDIPELCALDVKFIRKQLEQASDHKKHMALLPDFDTIQWHHLREDFMSQGVLGKAPEIKGGIVGEKGARVWAYWTRGFYGPIDNPESGNALHILRFVLEDEVDSQENADKLKSILILAQSEAETWKMGDVQFWNPTKLIMDLLQKTGLEYKEVDREEESITSLMWYGEGKGTTDEVEWVGNEKYGWC
ncbi:hypothetical protein ACMFMG_005483 [Clarireedia jacksonii]